MSTLAFIKKKIPYEDVRLEIEDVVRIVAKTIKPNALYLFGSAARNEFSDQSDIDLLIITEFAGDIKGNRLAIAKIRPFSKYPVDIIWMCRDDFNRKAEIGGIAQIVKEEGRLMYGSAE